jgi:hypothetical protein
MLCGDDFVKGMLEDFMPKRFLKVLKRAGAIIGCRSLKE